jgi:hypothetical protein
VISKRFVSAIPIVVAVVLLAGCAAPTPSPTHSHFSAPTPTPTPKAASAPGSRVPLGCADLLDESSWKAVAGASAVVDRDEDAAPTDIASIAQLQYGALSCVWDGTRTSSASNPGSELKVDIAPDAKAAFESRFAAIMADQSLSPHAAATENVAGDQSGYWCGTTLDALGPDIDIPDCDVEMLVSNYWVGIDVEAINGVTRSQVTAGLTAAMTEIAKKLAAAGPAPAQWAAPASTPSGFCTDATSTASVRSILGDATLVPAKAPPVATYASTVGLVGPSARCAWSSKSYGYFEVYSVAGGSWAFPAISPVMTGDSVFAGKPYVPLVVPGATSTKVACVGGLCEAFLAAGTTAVEIDYNDPGTGENAALLGSLAKTIAG